MTWINYGSKAIKEIYYWNPWVYDGNRNYTSIKAVYYWSKKIRPASVPEVYYSDEAFAEYQSLVDSVWSVQFVDTGKRFRFNYWVYIWNRTALDFMYGSNVMRTINLDTLTSTSKTLSVTMPSDRDLTIYYFWDNRILTPRWILDFSWNVITAFSYDWIVPWLPWVVRAHSWLDIYKGIVTWDNISFTKVWTSSADQYVWNICYSRLWAYLMNSDDSQWSWYSAYVNPTTNVVTSFPANTEHSRSAHAVSWPDWNLYRYLIRNAGWGRIQRVTTVSWDVLWTSLSTAWLAYGDRRWKFLWNIVSWWMNSSNWTWAWYWSTSYFVSTSWDVTKVQDNAFAYDTWVQTCLWFIDENWWIYPKTYKWWSWVILKTDKTFTNLNWKNPYLWR